MKINIDFQLKNLQGKEYDKFTRDKEGNLTDIIDDNANASKCLAITLYYSSDRNIKFSIWSQKLYEKGEIDIDSTDLDILIAWIENYVEDGIRQISNPFFAMNGIKSQVVEAIKKQKVNS